MTPEAAADLTRSGLAAFQQGRRVEAAAIADRVLAANPKDAAALYLRGLCLRSKGAVDEALACFRKVDTLRPGSPETANIMGLCLNDLGDRSGARKAFEEACRRGPHLPHPALNLAGLLFADRDFHGAEAAYRTALKASPAERGALRGLAHTLDTLNRGEEAETLADKILERFPDDPVGLSVKAGRLIARGEAEAALALFEGREPDPGDHPDSRAMAIGRQGEAFERLGRYEEAFACFKRGNDAVHRAAAPAYDRASGPFAPSTAEKLADFYREADWPEPGPAKEASPVFLVGFPRSGTTLLETVLAAHSKIRTSEEAPIARTVIDTASLDASGFAAFLNARPYEAAKRRKLYWREAEGGAPQKGGVFIDKLPLNLAWAGMLGQAFPDAKFILAVRDPRDCVLSAFKQRFAMNTAMFQMLTIEGAARYYDQVMRAGLAGLERLGEGRVIRVRYEDTVEDLPREAERVLEFLGLDPEEDMARYRERALERGVVTPSAPQVVQPVYSRSAGLWRNYEFALTPVRDILDPWAERFGYPV